MSDLNSKRFTLLRPPKLATISRKSMDELEFVKELLARLPTRRDQALVPVSTTQWPVVAHKRLAGGNGGRTGSGLILARDRFQGVSRRNSGLQEKLLASDAPVPRRLISWAPALWDERYGVAERNWRADRQCLSNARCQAENSSSEI